VFKPNSFFTRRCQYEQSEAVSYPACCSEHETDGAVPKKTAKSKGLRRAVVVTQKPREVRHLLSLVRWTVRLHFPLQANSTRAHRDPCFQVDKSSLVWLATVYISVGICFIFLKCHINVGLHGGVVVSTVASQQEDSCFETQLEPFCVEFACSPRVCVGSLRVLRR